MKKLLLILMLVLPASGQSIIQTSAQLGMKCDGATDDTQRFLNALGIGGGTQPVYIIFVNGTCNIKSVNPITVPSTITLDFTQAGALSLASGSTMNVSAAIVDLDNHAVFKGSGTYNVTPANPVGCTTISGGIACSATGGANNGVYYLSKNCSGATNCTQIFGDGQAVNDATSNSTTTVTCPNNDCNFVASDVGKAFWATNNGGSPAGTATSVVCPLTTIQTVNSAQSVTLANTCTASSVGNVFIYWGHRDGATLHALDATIGCVSIVPFSGAVIFIDQAIFISPPACSTSGISQATNVPQRDWVPVGSTVMLVITPDFNYSTCTGNGGTFLSTTVCIGSGLSQMYNTLVWGTGLLSGNNANCANASGKTIFALNPLGGFIDNFDLAGVCGGEPGNGAVMNSVDEQWREGGVQNSMTKGCVAASTALNTYNLDCENDSTGGTTNGHWVTNNATQSDFGTFPYGDVLIDAGSVLKTHGTTFHSHASGFFAVTTNGTHYSDGDVYQCNSSGMACVQISASGITGLMTAHNATFGGIAGGVANAIVVGTTSTTATFIDLGGNTSVGGFAGCATNVGGACNISGMQILSAGCQGTANASSTLGLYPYGQLTTPACTSTTVNLGAVMTRSGNMQGLNVLNSAAGVNASSGVVTVLRNNAATTITCTIGTATTGCRDFTHVVIYNVGDVISFQVTTQAADTLAGIKATVLVW